MPNRYQILNEETREVLQLDATDKRDVLVELLRRLGLKLVKTGDNMAGTCTLCGGVFRDDLPHYARSMCKHCYQVGQHRKSADPDILDKKCQTCEYGRRRDCQLTKRGVCIKEQPDESVREMAG